MVLTEKQSILEEDYNKDQFIQAVRRQGFDKIFAVPLDWSDPQDSDFYFYEIEMKQGGIDFVYRELTIISYLLTSLNAKVNVLVSPDYAIVIGKTEFLYNCFADVHQEIEEFGDYAEAIGETFLKQVSVYRSYYPKIGLVE